MRVVERGADRRVRDGTVYQRARRDGHRSGPDRRASVETQSLKLDPSLMSETVVEPQTEGGEAWVWAGPEFSSLKLCPACGMAALEGEVDCKGCGREPSDDSTWRTVCTAATNWMRLDNDPCFHRGCKCCVAHLRAPEREPVAWTTPENLRIIQSDSPGWADCWSTQLHKDGDVPLYAGEPPRGEALGWVLVGWAEGDVVTTISEGYVRKDRAELDCEHFNALADGLHYTVEPVGYAAPEPEGERIEGWAYKHDDEAGYDLDLCDGIPAPGAMWFSGILHQQGEPKDD